MKEFFDGPTPTLRDTQKLGNMTLDEAKQFLGIGSEETRVNAHDRGSALSRAATRIYCGVGTFGREPSLDQQNKNRYMEQKIQKAVALVDASDFKTIPAPASDFS
jgi:hypothetical protein